MIANCEKARNQYLADNPEVKNASIDPFNVDPLTHYINYGIKEGKKWKNELCTQDYQKITGQAPGTGQVPSPVLGTAQRLVLGLLPAPETDTDILSKPEPLNFIINDDTFNDDKQYIITDLYTAVIYLHRFSKTQINGGYIKISYIMPSGTMRPNATYVEDINTRKYKCKNLYIFKASHNITMDSRFDAELVIELVPTVHTSEKLYLCFLLRNTRYVDRQPSDIDNIITNSIKPPTHYTTMNFKLQKLIDPQQKKIIYKSGIDTVVIFLSPIAINEVDFSGYETITERLFTLYPVNGDYKILLPQKVEGFTEGFMEGVDSTINSEIISVFNQNLVTCTPVDDNDKSIVNKNTATYLVDGKKNKQNNEKALSIMFITTIVLIVTSFFGSPLLYKYTIANFITEPTQLSLFTGFITSILFLLGLILIIGGNRFDSNEMWVGMYIILYLSFSAIVIGRDRLLNKPDVDMADLSETLNSLRNNIGILYDSFVQSKSDVKSFDLYYFPIFGGAYIVLLAILIGVTVPLKTDKTLKKKEKKVKGYTAHLVDLIFSIGAIYGFIFLVWIVMAFKYSSSK